ncbi:MAG: hypothetical protein ACR2PI_01710 [Hyphomicrobiaceae bacterium]
MSTIQLLSCVLRTIALLLAVWTTTASGQTVNDFKELAGKLNQTEWELVTSEAKQRLPGLVLDKAELESLKWHLSTSQKAVDLWNSIRYREFKGLKTGIGFDGMGLVANLTAAQLESQVRRRFANNSKLIYVLDRIKGNPQLAKKLMRAALNGDADAAYVAMRAALIEHAKNKKAALQAEGVKYWKTLIGEVVPGKQLFERAGISPVDLYLQGLNDWAAFSKQARSRTNRAVLDCLHLRFEILKATSNARQAASDVGDLGLIGFNCAAERRKRDASGSPSSFARDVIGLLSTVARSTAALGSYKLQPGDLAGLLLAYDRQSNARKASEPFSRWLDDELARALSARKSKLRDALSAEQKREAERQKRIAEKALRILRDVMRRRAGITADEEDKRDDLVVRVLCEAAKRQFGAATANFEQGDLAAAGKDAREVLDRFSQKQELTPCIATRAAAQRLIARIAALRAILKEAQAARAACSQQRIERTLSRLRRWSPRHRLIDSEIPRLSRAMRAARLLAAGISDYRANKLDAAEVSLKDAIKAAEDTGPGDCFEVNAEATKYLDRITKIRAQVPLLTDALTACDKRKLRRLIGRYDRATHPFFQLALQSLRDRLDSCAAPQSDAQFAADCRTKHGARFQRVTRKDGQRVCTLCEPGYLSESGRCRATNATFERNCRTKYKKRFLRVDHKANGRRSCRFCKPGFLPNNGKCRRTDAAFEANCRRKYGERFLHVNHKANGRRSCQFCKPGFLPNNGKCRRTDAAFEANCRRKYGERFLHVNHKVNGRRSCRFCKPGFLPNNGKCRRTDAAFEANCRRKYKERFLRVILKSNGARSCQYCNPGFLPQNGKCTSRHAIAEANCKAKYGASYLRLQRTPSGYLCRYCQNGMVPHNGQCASRVAIFEQQCRQRYRGQFLRVKRQGQRLVCQFCNPGFRPSNGRCLRVVAPAVRPPPVRVEACNSRVKQGGDRPERVVVNLGNFAGRARFSFNMIRIPDRMQVYLGRRLVLDTGCISGSGQRFLNIPRGARQLQVIVQPNCQRKSRTQWSFRFQCPG